MQQLNSSIVFLSDNKYQIGEFLFDVKKRTLTYQQEKYCSKQVFKLLYAFVHNTEAFLSNNSIFWASV